jgi:zinc protease
VIARDAVFNSPENGLSLVEADLKGLTANQVNTALKDTFVGSGPLLFLSSTTPVEGGDARLATVFRDAENATLADGRPPDIAPWPYTSFGAPGTVSETRKIED